jgi:dolichol-phosphate mannosyltransferase
MSSRRIGFRGRFRRKRPAGDVIGPPAGDAGVLVEVPFAIGPAGEDQLASAFELPSAGFDDVDDDGAGRDARVGTAPLLSIVIPTRDERDNIARLVAALGAAELPDPVEFVFVDDSEDGTEQVIEAVRRQTGKDLRLLHRRAGKRTGGLGGAVLAGLRITRARWVCVMDADLQHPPDTIPRLFQRALGSGDDVVIASRFCEDGEVGRFGLVRRSLSRVSTLSAKLVFRDRLRNVTDPMSGFFLVRRDAIDADALRPLGFKILLEVLVSSRPLRVSEVPFVFGERYAGESKASLREAERYARQLWRLRGRTFAGRFGRFATVGATGLVVNTVLLAALAGRVGMYYIFAAILATQGSTLWNYVLTERWVFRRGRLRRRTSHRLAMFFLVNNVALVLRIPLLYVLTTVGGIHYLLSNIITIVILLVVRFTLADTWIWASSSDNAPTSFTYDIHGLVSVESESRLPELERFRIGETLEQPTIRLRLARIRSRPTNGTASSLDDGAEPGTSSIRYVEAGGRGFAVEITMGNPVEILASPFLRHSPHVLYTNVVEPVLRWTFVRHGYALVHGACLSVDGTAFLITARTDTGKTTTILKALDRYPHTFLSDDLTILSEDGRVLAYPKPLTISRHTVQAVKTPLLSRRERIALLVQSRLHSRSGRRFALVLAKTRLPAATINALAQWVVPPPKYDVSRLVPHAPLAPESQLAGMIVIERGGEGQRTLESEEALATLLANCEDAYGFPPYADIEHVLHSSNGSDWQAVERKIIARALDPTIATLLQSDRMDWFERLPAVLEPARRASNGQAPSAGTSASSAIGGTEIPSGDGGS